MNYRRLRCAEHVGRVEEINKMCLDSYGEEIYLKTSTLKAKEEMREQYKKESLRIG